MASSAVEKTAEELRKEIEELNRQQWEVEDGEIVEDIKEKDDIKEKQQGVEGKINPIQGNGRRLNIQRNQSGPRRDRGNQMEQEGQPVENVPRILPKDEDPSLVKRNKRMLGQLLGTLEKFREEDKHLSSTEAFMRRSDSLKRAEQRAREESERLRQQEREQLAEKRRRDLTLRARVVAKAEEKKLELLFLQWIEHHKKLCNFLRTKAEPPIFYVPAKPSDASAKLLEEQRKEFLQWRANRRQDLTEYQKQVSDQLLSNVEVELQRWQTAGNTRNGNTVANLQESMDNDLESHKLSHGLKTRLHRGGDEAQEDVEDVGDEDIMDDVLEEEENATRMDDNAGTSKGIVSYGSAED